MCSFRLLWQHNTCDNLYLLSLIIVMITYCIHFLLGFFTSGGYIFRPLLTLALVGCMPSESLVHPVYSLWRRSARLSHHPSLRGDK